MRSRLIPRLIEQVVLWSSLSIIAGGAAHAYIDPGTGSYVLQVLIASLLGAAFVVKATWKSLPGITRT